MQRRKALATVASIGGVIVSGCFGDLGAGDEPTGDGDPSGTGDGGNDGGSDGSKTDPETHFVVGTVEFIGTPEGSAAISFDGRTITVTGTIQGANSCYTARLDAVTVDDDTLRVQIVSFEDRDENDGCFEAIVGIDYELRVEGDSPLPASVRVVHNGETVATNRRS